MANRYGTPKNKNEQVSVGHFCEKHATVWEQKKRKKKSFFFFSCRPVFFWPPTEMTSFLPLIRCAQGGHHFQIESVSTIGGDGDTTNSSPGRSPKQPLPGIGLHDPLHGGRCQTSFSLFFPCSADHERDWPPCKVVFFGLATNALNVRNNVF